MKDYHELYLKFDVLFLADVFGKFRNNSSNYYELCPSHYLSTLSLCWDTLLNFKVNNKYLKSYAPKPKSKHILYLDSNNLHRYAMSKFLPTSEFKWIDVKESDLNKYTTNRLKGCVLEVDPAYPRELCELHNDYPLAQDKIEIKRKMLSNDQLRIADLYNIPIGYVKKLVPNLFDKKKYLLHFENLRLYFRLGLKLKKYIITY